MRRGVILLVLAPLMAALSLTGCGGSPTSASGGSAVLRGVALGSDGTAGGAARDVSALATSGGSVTVRVKEDPSLSTTVKANGSFELEGLPNGTITLEFLIDGVVVGTVTISGISDDVIVKLVVQIHRGEIKTRIVLIDLEIEDGDDDADKTCIINGGKVGKKIELEGTVASGSGTTFEMRVNGNRASDLVAVDASGASLKCNGLKGAKNGDDASCTSDLIQSGVRVHVRGTLLDCTTSDAQVIASEVMVKKAGE
jgi:hypothetical protein